jgi:hypothetical protein
MRSAARRDNPLSEDTGLVRSEKGPRSVLLIDSDDRTSGTPFNFTVDLGLPLANVRYIHLRKVIIPKFSNINAGNNKFTLKSALGSVDVELNPGFYNTTTISNEITRAINYSFSTAAIPYTVSTSFDTITRAFTIKSVGGNNMFIVETSQLIKYGRTLIPFDSEPVGNVPSSPIIYSGVSPMIPTRYVTISSDSLCQHQFGRSLMSTATKTSNIVGIADTSEIYQDRDWDISVPFKGIYQPVVAQAYPIPVMSASDRLVHQVDITLVDGYGRSLSTLYTPASPNQTETALSIVLVFEIIF